MSRSRIVVSGMLAGVPGHGGATWAVLQYLLGLRRLGHDVWFVEPVPAGTLRLDRTSPVEAYFRGVRSHFDLDQSALVEPSSGVSAGCDPTVLADALRTADVLVDLAGTLGAPAAASTMAQVGAPVRVYVDLDPAFTQLWHEQGGIDMGFGGHTHFVTVGLGIGGSDCDVPLCGRRWLTTLPPVVLDHWRPADGRSALGYTTVANWRSYGPLQWGSAVLGQKCHSFRRLARLPEITGQPFAIAARVNSSEPDRTLLRAHGWTLLDPEVQAGTPQRYQAFVDASSAEVGLTKSGYVASRCGWFSDRSACYLAAGRPVVAEDTGFSRHLPTGAGLLAFDDVDGAADGVGRVDADYRAHASAARGLAEEFFDSDRVLPSLLDRLAAA